MPGAGLRGPGGDAAALDTGVGPTAVLISTGFALLLAITLCVIVSSSKFRHATATAMDLVTPTRARVLIAQAVAAAVASRTTVQADIA